MADQRAQAEDATANAQIESFAGIGTETPSTVSTDGGTPSEARMDAAGVLMLPQLKPCISDEKSTTQTVDTRGLLRPPCT